MGGGGRGRNREQVIKWTTQCNLPTGEDELPAEWHNDSQAYWKEKKKTKDWHKSRWWNCRAPERKRRPCNLPERGKQVSPRGVRNLESHQSSRGDSETCPQTLHGLPRKLGGTWEGQAPLMPPCAHRQGALCPCLPHAAAESCIYQNLVCDGHGIMDKCFSVK